MMIVGQLMNTKQSFSDIGSPLEKESIEVGKGQASNYKALGANVRVWSHMGR